MLERPTIESLRIEEKLTQLRVGYKKYPKKRDIIIRQARALNIAKEKLLEKEKNKTISIPIPPTTIKSPLVGMG